MSGAFTGMSVLITGGASGIGRATALMLVSQGARVASLDLVSSGEAEENIFEVVGDVSSASSTARAVEQAAQHMGGLDVVVNNAGVGAQGSVEADDGWDRVWAVNVMGTVHTTRAALPWLRRSTCACVVNTGSIAGWRGLPNRAAYSASKGAVHALTMAMAADHLTDGIRVNAVAPGTADTPWVQRLLAAAADPEAERSALEKRQPTGRLVTADEVAHAICFLASPLSSATTGAILAVDGGSQPLLAPPRPPRG